MNIRDIEATFGRIQEAMASQRNVILQLQKDVVGIKKELAEARAQMDELSLSAETDQDADDVIEVVKS